MRQGSELRKLVDAPKLRLHAEVLRLRRCANVLRKRRAVLKKPDEPGNKLSQLGMRAPRNFAVK